MIPLSRTALLFLGLWYATSLVTLFMNKFILTSGVDAQVLAVVQMTTTCVMGAAKVYAGAGKREEMKETFTPLFFQRMFFVGLMRFSTVVLGLVSLKFVPVSFTETIKSSAPFFTVLFAWVILHEHTPTLTKVALVPIAGGLALASATELEFHIIGFLAAVMNNCVDCIQNVYSKKLLTLQFTYVELQFYTSLAAVIIQIPLWVLSSLYMGGATLSKLNIEPRIVGWLAIDATSYHLQSVFAYGLMSQISPVTHSVANTVKRAMLIWLSVLFFGNSVTLASCIGTGMVVLGVFFYNYSRQIEQPRSSRAPSKSAAARKAETLV